MNPVRAGIVEKEEGYLNSSTGAFYGVRRSKLELNRFVKRPVHRTYDRASEWQIPKSRAWLLKVLSHNEKIWFWEEGYHGEEIMTVEFFESKLNYIHMNPVRAGIVEKEEEYLNSSAGTLYGIRSSIWY